MGEKERARERERAKRLDRSRADEREGKMAYANEVKLFGKWSYDDIEVNDMALEDYIAVKPKVAVYVPHTGGRYQAKRFRKAQCPIAERLACSLMMHGRNNGKKLMANRIVKHTFDIIHLLTDQNPIQIVVDAVINSGPREDATRIGSAGVAGGRPSMSPPEESQPGHLAPYHRRQGGRLQKHQNSARVPSRRAHQCRQGILQLLRHQEEGRGRACRQGQQI